MLPTYMTMVDYYGFVTQLWGGGGGGRGEQCPPLLHNYV